MAYWTVPMRISPLLISMLTLSACSTSTTKLPHQIESAREVVIGAKPDDVAKVILVPRGNRLFLFPRGLNPDGTRCMLGCASPGKRNDFSYGIFCVTDGLFSPLDRLEPLMDAAWASNNRLVTVEFGAVYDCRVEPGKPVQSSRYALPPELMGATAALSPSGSAVAWSTYPNMDDKRYFGLCHLSTNVTEYEEIPVSRARIVWVDDSTLEIGEKDFFAEVKVDAAKGRIENLRRKTLPLATVEYVCMIQGKPLYIDGRRLMLADRVVLTLSEYALHRAFNTQSTVFVVTVDKQLYAFDKASHKTFSRGVGENLEFGAASGNRILAVEDAKCIKAFKLDSDGISESEWASIQVTE